VRIAGGGIGQTAASGEYSTLKCQVHWVLKEVDAKEILVQEIVDPGPDCTNVDIVLTLLNDGTIHYVFDGGLGRAVLTRVS
jgi:hypothetical protein